MRSGLALVIAAAWLGGSLAGCASPEAPTEPTKVEEAGQPGMATIPEPPKRIEQTDPPVVDQETPSSCKHGPEVDPKQRLGPKREEREQEGAGFYATKATPPGPRSDAAGDVLLSLSGSSAVAAGQGLGLSATFANRGRDAVTLMRSLDGSDAHWRFPTFDLYAKDERGQTYRWTYTGGRCGMVNPVTDEDFFTVAAGTKEPAPTAWAGFVEATLPEGRYELWLVYTLCTGSVRNDENDQAAIAERKVTTGRWASNALTVTVSAATAKQP